MKFTLVVVLYAINHIYSTTASTTNGSNYSTSSSGTYITQSTNRTNTKISIPMPDLKSCIEARKQFDSYENLIAATCDAKE